jgi:hypothetical protein
MSDYSLMNPDHLRKEIHDIEHELVPQTEQFAEKVSADIDRIRGYVADQYNDVTNDQIVLTREQVQDVLRTLAEIDMYRWRYFRPHQFALKVYKNLLKDRRYFIAAKYLRFLK